MDLSKYKRWAWLNGELSWKLHAAQTVIYKLIRSLPEDQREALVLCARRFGKSFLGVILALEDMLRNPGVQVAIIGPTHKQTRSIVTPLIRKITEDAPGDLITHGKSTSTWFASNGSSLILGGFDTILESLRGLDIYSCYLEESGLAPHDYEEYYYLLYSVLFPTLMHSRGRVVHLTTLPRVLGHPLITETIPKTKLNQAFYQFNIEQNPLLTAEEIEKEVELLGGRESPTVRRELYCEIVRDESVTVVTTFDRERHVAEIEPSHALQWIVGGDLGYTADLSCFLLAGFDHTLGKVLVYDEKSFPPTTPSSVIVEALGDWKPYEASVVADIQGNTRIDMSGLGLQTATPLKDKFDSTITFLRNEFWQDRLVIHPRCKLLIETCESAMFNRQKTDFLRTSTLGHADALMALVYTLRSVDRVTDLRPKAPPSEVFRMSYESDFDKNLKNLSWG